MPSLHLTGLSEGLYFTPHSLARARSFSRGEDVIWALGVIAELVALGVLVRVLPRSARTIGLGRIGSAIVVAMVILVTLWAVSLPFGLAGQWWQHHFGLGPFDIGAWFSSQWSTLLPQAVAAMAGIVLVVGLAGRFARRWWLAAGPVVVAIGALFAFVSGYLPGGPTHPLRNPALAADVRTLEAREHVQGTPVGVQVVSNVTNQANAFTNGFGPSTHVVLWNTLLDGRFSRREIDVVIAHELGHVRSRHILKAVGWSALTVLPALWLLGLATRRRGGIGDPANLPFAILVLTVLSLLVTPLENAVSRRYEAEADWRALNATHDPRAAAGLFEGFERTSLDDPDPGILDYLWLENHPTLMQRIAMTRAWSKRMRG